MYNSESLLCFVVFNLKKYYFVAIFVSCRETNEMFLEPCKNNKRDAVSCILYICCYITFICINANYAQKTLEEIILRRVRPGTHIITDCWQAYNGLADKGSDIF